MSVLGYYPGCSLRSSANEYDRSLRAVAGQLGVTPHVLQVRLQFGPCRCLTNVDIFHGLQCECGAIPSVEPLVDSG